MPPKVYGGIAVCETQNGAYAEGNKCEKESVCERVVAVFVGMK
jgi:hypothetical protein